MESKSKIIHFMRHGQAAHNVGPGGSTIPTIHDPTLTPHGHRQAEEGCVTVAKYLPEIQLIVVSPLSRTLQTALSVYGSATCPIIAQELCREQYGEVICDSRSKTSILREQYGKQVDFSLIETEEDVLWSPFRETEVSTLVCVHMCYECIL